MKEAIECLWVKYSHQSYAALLSPNAGLKHYAAKTTGGDTMFHS
jgi:hypothetical protein